MSLASLSDCCHCSPVNMHFGSFSLPHARPACRLPESYALRGVRGNHFLLSGASKIFICRAARPVMLFYRERKFS
jgi:hypothetical protein